MIVKEAVVLFDTSVWTLRDIIRNIELTRNTISPPRPDYPRLHDLARHIIHSSETLSIAIETMSSMIDQYEAYLAERPSLSKAAITKSQQTRKSIQFQTSLLRCLKARSIALEDRLRNEINLAFNVVSQYDSAVTVRIGRAAQNDSAAMKTIAVLTLVFLPGTFISHDYRQFLV
jgi:Mg2+ and Co2+ transporter CorA